MLITECRLDAMNASSELNLSTLRMPNRQTEEYRFTDLAAMTRRELQVCRRRLLNASPNLWYHARVHSLLVGHQLFTRVGSRPPS